MYNREDIEKVRTAVDLADLVRDYVPSLKNAGRSIKGNCPFHSERTPSFFVHPDKGMYKCFGCGESGDAITFLSKVEGMTFVEALEKLAERSGVRLEKKAHQDRTEKESPREQILRVLDAARSFYKEKLWETTDGEVARGYLEKRGLSAETLERFQLGLAPQRDGSAFEHLLKKGFSIEICRQAGLVNRSREGRYFDPLYGRIIFPIFDNFGHTVGFGGRLVPQSGKKVLGVSVGNETSEDSPKYINSPETPVFSKGRLLYGLGFAKPTFLKKRRAVILEGYMDVIGSAQGGFPGVVATLGTALTRDHAKILKRYVDEVVLFFDPDEAGERATQRGLEPLIQEELFARIVIPDENLDPDEIMAQHGLEHFEEMISGAPDFVTFFVNRILKLKSEDVQGKTQALQQILRLISQSPNPILMAEWMKIISEKTGIPKNSLESELNRTRGVQPKEKFSEPAPVRRPVQRKKLAIPGAEEEFLQLLMQVPEAWGQLDFDGTELSTTLCRKVFDLMVEQQTSNGKVSVPGLLDAFEGEAREWLTALALEERTVSEPIIWRDQMIRNIRLINDKKRLTQLSHELARGDASQDVVMEYRQLLRRVKGSDRAPLGTSSPA